MIINDCFNPSGQASDYFWRTAGPWSSLAENVIFCTTVISCKISMDNYGDLLLNICARTLTLSMVPKDASSGSETEWKV